MLLLKKDFAEYIEQNDVIVDDEESFISEIRLNITIKHIRDFLYLYNRSKNHSILKRKEELEREIQEFEQLKGSTDGFDKFGFTYDSLPKIARMKYEIISKFSDSSLQQKRITNNYENIQKLLNFLFNYFNRKEYFIPYNDSNENSLNLHNLILVEHIIFEKIYKEVDRIVSISSSTPNFANIITNETNELLNKYNSIELISTVMNKYFTDNNLQGISENDSPRKNFRIMRSLIPQNVKDSMFISHRNMSSHGDFYIQKDDLEKDGSIENISNLKSRITNIISSVSDIQERNYYLRLLSFPSSASTIEDFIIISASSLIEYNYEHYLKDEISKEETEKMSEAFTIIDMNTNSVEKLEFNLILEIIKHSIGHHNVNFSDNIITFTNPKTEKIVKVDLYDYIEIFLTNYLAVVNSFTSEFRKYNEELQKNGLPAEVLPYRYEIRADGTIQEIIEKHKENCFKQK